jgi:hypothetical protein
MVPVTVPRRSLSMPRLLRMPSTMVHTVRVVVSMRRDHGVVLEVLLQLVLEELVLEHSLSRALGQAASQFVEASHVHGSRPPRAALTESSVVIAHVHAPYEPCLARFFDDAVCLAPLLAAR